MILSIYRAIVLAQAINSNWPHIRPLSALAYGKLLSGLTGLDFRVVLRLIRTNKVSMANILSHYQSGTIDQLRVLDILTDKSFGEPYRPTSSAAIYQQQVGRFMRDGNKVVREKPAANPIINRTHSVSLSLHNDVVQFAEAAGLMKFSVDSQIQISPREILALLEDFRNKHVVHVPAGIRVDAGFKMDVANADYANYIKNIAKGSGHVIDVTGWTKEKAVSVMCSLCNAVRAFSDNLTNPGYAVNIPDIVHKGKVAVGSPIEAFRKLNLNNVDDCRIARTIFANYIREINTFVNDKELEL